jgi:ribosomal-protein-alanine N-acetyltransferase
LIMCRPARAGDAKAMAALHRTGFDRPWSEGDIAELIDRPGTFGLIAGENVDGFILVQVAADEAEVLTIVVAESARSQGMGRKLIEAAALQAHSKGARVFFLEVSVTNRAARALYGKLGFVEVGRRPAYYRNKNLPAEDAILLKSELPLSPDGKKPAGAVA